jgi:hypothetical protein
MRIVKINRNDIQLDDIILRPVTGIELHKGKVVRIEEAREDDDRLLVLRDVIIDDETR